MQYLKIALISISALGLLGCVAAPLKYDTESTRLPAATKVSGSFDELGIGEFSYSAPGKLSQFELSTFGCLPCMADGTRGGLVFTTPIKDIVAAEVTNVLKDFQLGGAKKTCTIGGVVNLAGYNTGNGEQSLDVTYVISKSGRDVVKERIFEKNYEGLFAAQRIDRILNRVTQKTVEVFLTNKRVRQVYKEHCAS